MTPSCAGVGEFEWDGGPVLVPGAMPWLSASLRANASSPVFRSGMSAGGGGGGAKDAGGANEGGGANAAGGAN